MIEHNVKLSVFLLLGLSLLSSFFLVNAWVIPTEVTLTAINNNENYEGTAKLWVVVQGYGGDGKISGTPLVFERYQDGNWYWMEIGETAPDGHGEWIVGGAQDGTNGGYYTFRAMAGFSDAYVYSNQIEIPLPTTLPTADFYSNTAGGSVPYEAQFYDHSYGFVELWQWDFGDGGTSTSKNPIHTYTEPGSYAVTLIIQGPYGTDIEQKNDYILVTSPPHAEFTFSPDYPLAGEEIVFDATSSSDPNGQIISYTWTFGDDYPVTTSNPQISYYFLNSGNYTVSLTITNNYGITNTALKQVKIESPYPVAGFFAEPTGGPKPLTVLFFDQSSPSSRIDTWSWDFNGDGIIDSNSQSPSFTYTESGTFTVLHSVTNSYGSDDEVKTDYINVYNPYFTIIASSGSGGEIAPNGKVQVPREESQVFTIEPDEGYNVYDVLVDGVSQGPISSYTFTNVGEDHTIEAIFSENSHTGSITLDQTEYTDYTQWAEVTVIDPDLNKIPYECDTAHITAYSYDRTNMGVPIGILDVVVEETSSNSGKFIGNFGFNPGFSTDGKINVTVKNPGILTVEYIDEIDAEGNLNQPRYYSSPYNFQVDIELQERDFILLGGTDPATHSPRNFPYPYM